ncbi:endonuclease VII [Klebsiella phage vB_Kpn_K19PH14C4P1]|uniref:Endonuclease VII n=1 Tax=Klebsiella phage vB_Kpn_K19PH14C4P1 TaxID=3071650 RepID=A0AAV1MKY9_9CAUD|nr:endonuclease VII [Klebsiella phage vB_Kpn_K19PH14C4P1]
MPAHRKEIINGRKECSKCLTVKPLEEFGKSSRPGGQSQCKECRQSGKRGRPVSSTQRESHRAWVLLNTYGITVDDFNKMLEDQAGVCKICGKGPSGRFKHLCVDHCHTTGQVRGLLCHACNKSLGFLEDDPDRIKRLIAYLGGAQCR